MTQPSTLVVFDIDATLLHSRGCGRVALEAAMRQVYKRMADLSFRELSGKVDWQVLLEATNLSVDELSERLPEFEEAVASHLTRIIDRYDIVPTPGAMELVETLAEDSRVLLSLLTGNVYRAAMIKLRAAGFDTELFKVGAYGADAPRRDMLPPVVLERAHAMTGVHFEGAHVVCIGDTPNDVLAARSVEARTVAVLTGKWGRVMMKVYKPDYVFEDLTDTAAVLEAIFA